MLEQLNAIFFELINNFAGHNQKLDKLIIFLALYSPYIFIAVLIYLWFKTNKNAKNIALYAIYAVLLGLALNFIIGQLYFHARPFAQGLGQTLIQHNADSSFPSDHTTFMFSIAFMLLFFKTTKKIGLSLSLFGLLAAFSRIYVGVHFPLDIIASLLVASLAANFIFLWRAKLHILNQFIINLSSWPPK